MPACRTCNAGRGTWDLGQAPAGASSVTIVHGFFVFHAGGGRPWFNANNRSDADLPPWRLPSRHGATAAPGGGQTFLVSLLSAMAWRMSRGAAWSTIWRRSNRGQAISRASGPERDEASGICGGWPSFSSLGDAAMHGSPGLALQPRTGHWRFCGGQHGRQPRPRPMSS